MTKSQITRSLLTALSIAIAATLATPAQAEMVTLTKASLRTAVSEASGVLVVELTAPWCVNCKLAKRRVLGLAERFEGNLRIAELDVDKNWSVMEKYDVAAVPAVLVFANGREVARHIGVPSDEWLQSAAAAHGATTRLPRSTNPVVLAASSTAAAAGR